MPPAYLDRDHIGAYCPACGTGTLSIQFLDGPPRLRIGTRTDRPDDQCSHGCPVDQIRPLLV
jgi:hypothetical protein